MPQDNDTPAPESATPSPVKWETCSPRDRARARLRGATEPTFYAAIGLYEVWLSFDGECWRWEVDYAGQTGMPEPLVDAAHGLFGMGNDQCARARAERMARVLSGMVEGDSEASS